MFCIQCGNQLEEGAVFCPYCGAQQNAGAVTPAQFDQQYTQHQNMYSQNAGEAHHGKVGFGEAISLFFKNYVNFNGRASKSEYWWIFLFNMIIFIPLSIISGVFPLLGSLCSFALMIPGISLSVRRLHDTGKPGTYCFIGLIPLAGGIILLIQLLKDSEGDNQWGPGPIDVGFAGTQYAAPVNVTPAQRGITDNDIYVMAQNHAPFNFNDPGAKCYMDAALNKIVPTYTGNESLENAMLLCDPQNIKANISAVDTDTLLVIFKALGYYINQGGDVNILGIVQRNVLDALKIRF